MPPAFKAAVLALLATLPGCASGQAGDDGGALAETSTDSTIQFPDSGPTDALGAPEGTGGTITVTAPAGGETFPAGSQQTLSWTSSGAVGSVDIELWRAGSKHGDVAQGQAPSGSYAWSVPVDTPRGDDYTLRVADPASGAAGTSAAFAIANWRFRAPISVTSTMALADYQVRVTLDDAGFTYANASPDGADLRFGSTSAPGTFDLPHWIEDWSPGGTSHVWVKVPALSAGQATTIYLFYGMAGASDAGDVQATFPSQLVSSGNLTLNGPQEVDWFELKAGDTLTLGSGQPLTIKARRILISGSVDGTGKGHAGGTGGGAGQGPGGGGGATNSGAGGGSYGGKGGTGGYDSADTPGTGGPVYGSSSGSSIEMGSGGGAGSSQVGGAGGGALTLEGEQVLVSGAIAVNGEAGIGAGQSSGGGAGGGILIIGEAVSLTGSCAARGGAGGSGSSTANDGGGGGGGGRIKVLHGEPMGAAPSLVVTGGAGGQYGDVASGTAGAKGSSYTAQQGYSPVTVTVGAEEPAE